MPELTPRFWQAFLSVHLPASRTALLLQEVRSSHFDPVATLLSSSHLRENEKHIIRSSGTEVLERALQAGASVVTPPYTNGIDPDQYPPALFAWGNIAALDGPKVAIVGTRRCTTYGQAAAQKMAEFLSLNGVCVVSGGAMGIDTAAHKGALEGGGKTLCVLPGGIDKTTTSSNKALFDRIRERGCLLSQFAFGMSTDSKTPLFRNQTVAAMSDAVLLVEAPHESGSINTAQAALEQGKPVFVVPGPITSPTFNGSHELLRAGALLVYHPDQILREMGWDSGVLRPEVVLSDEKSQILSELGERPLTIEVLATRLELDPLDVGEMLSDMELEGLVKRAGAGYSVV